jgi:hypothetical protein
MFMRAKNALYFGANLAVVWTAMLIYWFGPHYRSYLYPGTKWALLAMAAIFTLSGIVTHLILGGTREKVTKGWLAFRGFGRLAQEAAAWWNKFVRPGAPAPPQIDLDQARIERTAALFLAVKLFYIPFITNSLVNLIRNLAIHGSNLDLIDLSVATFNETWYPFLLAVLYFIDSAFFWVGYQFESGKVGNVVRSVDPTFLGWFVTLCCYPPFSAYSSKLLGSIPFDENRVIEGDPLATLALKLGFLFWSVIFVWASVALGWKCSNLTNRGTIDTGPYALIRHPAYLAKLSSWLVMIIPVLDWKAALSLLAWGFVYYLRAMTEEDHMSRDPEYLAYKERVRYRFIPFVY